MADWLDFATFRRASVRRCRETFGHQDWTITDWGCALAGEVGELCNLVKKRRRGDEGITDKMLADEAGDVVAYLDLLTHRLGIDLGRAVRQKFDEVSERVGSPVRLTEQGLPPGASTGEHEWALATARSVRASIQKQAPELHPDDTSRSFVARVTEHWEQGIARAIANVRRQARLEIKRDASQVLRERIDDLRGCDERTLVAFEECLETVEDL